MVSHSIRRTLCSTTLLHRPELGTLEFPADDSEAILCQAQPILPVVKMLTQAQEGLNCGRSREAGFLIDECLQRLREHLPPEILRDIIDNCRQRTRGERRG